MPPTLSAAPHAPTTAGTRPVLQVEQISKRYGQHLAVREVSFEVRRGEIVGLLGPNGAGKTTTLSMVLGVLEPTDGRVLIEGLDVQRQRRRALAHTNFAAVYAPLPGNLSVIENLRFFGHLYAVRALERRIETLIERFALGRFRHTRCGVLSSGEQTRVCLAKALLNAPSLLLLDEPTASLDPATARAIRAQIRAIAAEGNGGILWTSHNMLEVQEVCDRVLFLSQGRVLLQGDPRRLPAEHGEATLDDLFVRLARHAAPAGAEGAAS